MISLIVCSANINIFKKFKDSVQKTIGIEHEIVRIDNMQNLYGICEAYNLGASKAKFDLLCFVHEDVAFLTKNWGEILLNYFINKTTGLLGIAGTQYKTKTTGGWWTSGPLTKIKLVQGNKNKSKSPQAINQSASNYELGVCIDGVFMVTPKKVWNEIRFDENTLKKFHCYDLDYSFYVFQKGYDILICYDILLEHFSDGNYDKTWYEQTVILHKKWSRCLPISLPCIPEKEKIKAEWEIKKSMTRFLVQNKYPIGVILKNIFGKMYKFSLKKCLICIIEIYKAKKTNKT